MKTLRPPYAHLNLCFNPFGELPPEERAELAVADVAADAAELRTPGARVQYLGEPGRGKSTHLLALHRNFPGAPYVVVRPDGDSPVPRAPIVFVDGADLLPPASRVRLLARAGSVAWTAHVDLGAVRTRAVGGITPERLGEVFRRRIEHARRGPGPVPVVPEKTLSELIDRCGDDVRAMEGILYGRFQRMESAGHVEV